MNCENRCYLGFFLAGPRPAFAADCFPVVRVLVFFLAARFDARAADLLLEPGELLPTRFFAAFFLTFAGGESAFVLFVFVEFVFAVLRVPLVGDLFCPDFFFDFFVVAVALASSAGGPSSSMPKTSERSAAATRRRRPPRVVASATASSAEAVINSAYAGEKNKAALVRLLAPVERATEESELVRALVDSGDIFHPLAWTPREAYAFLKEVPRYEAAGIVVRLPDWWRKRPRPQVGVQIGEKKKSTLGIDAMLEFRVQTVLGAATSRYSAPRIGGALDNVRASVVRSGGSMGSS